MSLAGPFYVTQGPVLIAAWLMIRPPESCVSHEARNPDYDIVHHNAFSQEIIIDQQSTQRAPKKTCKNKGVKANSNAKAYIGQSWKFRLTPPAFPQRAFELNLVVSFPPTLQALAVLCWTKLLLPQQQVVLLSLHRLFFNSDNFLVVSSCLVEKALPAALRELLLSRSMSRGASFSFKHCFTFFRRRAIHAASETGFLVAPWLVFAPKGACFKLPWTQGGLSCPKKIIFLPVLSAAASFSRVSRPSVLRTVMESTAPSCCRRTEG